MESEERHGSRAPRPAPQPAVASLAALLTLSLAAPPLLCKYVWRCVRRGEGEEGAGSCCAGIFEAAMARKAAMAAESQS
eukprot:3605776-Rhodomonas_salina.1